MESSLSCSRPRRASSSWWAAIAEESSTCPSPSRKPSIILRYRVIQLLQIFALRNSSAMCTRYRVKVNLQLACVGIPIQWLINRNVRATISLCLSNVCCVFISSIINYILKWVFSICLTDIDRYCHRVVTLLIRELISRSSFSHFRHELIGFLGVEDNQRDTSGSCRD